MNIQSPGVKTAIVTGSSGNMGQAVVKKFIDEGYYVIGTVIPNDPYLWIFLQTNLKKLLLIC